MRSNDRVDFQVGDLVSYENGMDSFMTTRNLGLGIVTFVEFGFIHCSVYWSKMKTVSAPSCSNLKLLSRGQRNEV